LSIFLFERFKINKKTNIYKWLIKSFNM
jgi:hypothetical protein